MASAGTVTTSFVADVGAFSSQVNGAATSVKRMASSVRESARDVESSGDRMGNAFKLSGGQIARAAKESTLGLLLLSNTASGVAGGLARTAAHMAHGFAHGGVLAAGIMGTVSLFGVLAESIHKSREEDEKRLQAITKQRQYNDELERQVRIQEAGGPKQGMGAVMDYMGKISDARGQGGQTGADLQQRLLDLEAHREKAAERAKALEESKAKSEKAAAAAKEEHLRNVAAAEAHTRELYLKSREEQTRKTDALITERRAQHETIGMLQLEATLTKEQLPYVRDLAHARDLEAAGLTKQAEKIREIVKYQIDLSKYQAATEQAKAHAERGAVADAATKQRLAIMQATTEEQRTQLKMVDEFNRRVKDGETAALVWKELTAENAKEFAKLAEAQTHASQAMRDRVELARAETDQARELVRLRQELRDAIREGNVEAANGLKELIALEKQREAAAEAKKKKDSLPTTAGEARERRKKRLHESKEAKGAFRRQYDEDGNPVYRDGPIGVIGPEKPRGTGFDGLFGGDSKYPSSKEPKGPTRFGPYGPLKPGEFAPPDVPNFGATPPMPTPPQSSAPPVTPPDVPTEELKAGASSLESGANALGEANKALGEVADKALEAGAKTTESAAAVENEGKAVENLSTTITTWATKTTDAAIAAAEAAKKAIEAVEALTRKLSAAGLIGG